LFTVVAVWPRARAIQVVSEPPGAKVLVNQHEQPGTTPLKVKLKKGDYVIAVRHETLGTLSTNWPVGHRTPALLQFQFPYGSVAFETDPPGATVELDGKSVGTTPYKSGPLPPGQRHYTLRLRDYEPVKLPDVVVPADGRTFSSPPVKLNRRKPGEGSVEISSVPNGAQIFDGTQELGVTPMTKFLSAGSHRLTAHFPGLTETTISTQVMIVAAAPSPVEFRFAYGTLRFDVTPPEAEILINNKLLGASRDISRKIL